METPTQESTEFTGSLVRVLADQLSFMLETFSVVELVDSKSATLTPVPGANKGMVGMLNHRGRVVPIFDLRSLIGAKSRHDETEELREFLTAREQDHISWLEELRNSVKFGTKFTKALDPTKCAFGKWYELLRTDDHLRQRITNGSSSIERILSNFDEPHKLIHGIAEEVLALAKNGQTAEANQIIDRVWNTELASMKRLFSELLETYVDSVSGRIVLLSIQSSGVGLLVDGVLEVAEYKNLAMDQETGMGSTLLPDGTLSFPIFEDKLLSMLGSESVAA